MNKNFIFEDLIVKLPQLDNEKINLNLKTMTNDKILDKNENRLDKMIDEIGFRFFKGASILANPYSSINLNKVDLSYYNRFISNIPIEKCKEQKKIMTRAYYKLWEIIDYFKLIREDYPDGMLASNTAEGPGGFIQGLIYYRILNGKKKNFLKDKYKAITIKTGDNLDFNHKVTQDFRNTFQNKYNLLDISYGGDDGDLTKIKVVKNYINNFKDRKADIFTGDGGGDHSSSLLIKEPENSQLVICQAIIGLSVLNKGGNFILKAYTITVPSSYQLVQLLASYFEEFYVTKPVTSRVFNNETYIVGKNFKGIKEEELNKLHTLIENLKEIQNQGKYIYELFSNSIDRELKIQVDRFSQSHYEIRLKLFNEIKNIIKNRKNKNVIKKYVDNVEKTSIGWCTKMKLDFLIDI